MGETSDTILSVDCFLSDCKFLFSYLVYPCAASLSSFASSNNYLKALMTLLMPIMVVICMLGFWFTLAAIRKKSRKNLKKNFTLSTVVLLYILHPPLITTGMGLFNCIELESNEFWLVKDLQVRCWDSEHSRFAFGIGIPMLVVWGLGLPIAGFIALYWNRNRLFHQDVLGRFRMMYQGLSPQYYYWEFINIIRKVLLLVINTFMISSGNMLQVKISLDLSLQALIAVLILVLALRLQE